MRCGVKKKYYNDLKKNTKNPQTWGLLAFQEVDRKAAKQNCKGKQGKMSELI